MRSASVFSLRVAVAALALAAAGCSTVSDGMGAMKSAVTPSGGSTSSAPTAAAPVRPPPPVYATPVNPATQRAFDRAIAQASPELGGPHANLGVIYRQAGKVDDSVREFETAVKLSPRQPIYLNQLGIAYRQQGQFAKARDAYQRALAEDPGYAAAMLNLGILYDLYLGDTQRALEQYARYLSLLPNGDPTVSKWVADLKNRKPGQPITVSRQEKP